MVYWQRECVCVCVCVCVHLNMLSEISYLHSICLSVHSTNIYVCLKSDIGIYILDTEVVTISVK